MKRLVALLPVLIALQVGVQPALAWTWPVDGPVVRPFVLGDDPYAAGQHRGIDVGAAAGSPVRAPAAGTVSFAGWVPAGGRTLTIQTADGYSVTLVHLGSIALARGAPVAEGAPVGSVGPSGDAELSDPYVHLGVRVTAEANGYRDPLAFLPPRAVPEEPAPADEPVRQEDPAPSQEEPQGDNVPAASAPGGTEEKPQGSPRRATGSADRRRPAERRGSDALEPASARPSEDAARRRRRQGTASAHPRAQTGFAEPLPRATDVAPAAPAAAPGSETGGDRRLVPLLAALGLGIGVALALAVLRRQLRDARPADGAPAMPLDAVRLPAEHAGGPRLAQHDRVLPDRDLERVLLGEAEALADLDRDDDPAELVDVADDSRSRHSPCRARGRAHTNQLLAVVARGSVRRDPVAAWIHSPVPNRFHSETAALSREKASV